MKPGFWLARSKIIDPVKYMEYVRQAGPVSKLYGAEMLVKGGRHTILEGVTTFERHVLVKYPSYESALEFYHSDAYQRAAALRLGGAGINELVIVEGEEPG